MTEGRCNNGSLHAGYSSWATTKHTNIGKDKKSSFITADIDSGSSMNVYAEGTYLENVLAQKPCARISLVNSL